MVFYVGKLIIYLKLFYKSNRPHFLWVYWCDNPRGMLGEHSKSLWIMSWGDWFTSFSIVLPTSQVVHIFLDSLILRAFIISRISIGILFSVVRCTIMYLCVVTEAVLVFVVYDFHHLPSKFKIIVDSDKQCI